MKANGVVGFVKSVSDAQSHLLLMSSCRHSVLPTTTMNPSYQSLFCWFRFVFACFLIMLVIPRVLSIGCRPSEPRFPSNISPCKATAQSPILRECSFRYPQAANPQEYDICSTSTCFYNISNASNTRICSSQQNCPNNASDSNPACRSDADCGALYGSNFVCVIDDSGFCPGGTVCCLTDSCPAPMPFRRRRGMEQVTRVKTDVKLMRDERGTFVVSK